MTPLPLRFLAVLFTVFAAALTAHAQTNPGSPTNVVATRGDQIAKITFTAPASEGGSPITSYRITVTPGGSSVTTTNTSLIFPGLFNGIAYTFTVAAYNDFGPGAASDASNSVTPVATSVSATTNITATSATLNGTFIPNYTSIGGFPRTAQFIYGSLDGAGDIVPVGSALADQSPVSGAADTPLSATITGLSPDTLYYFQLFNGNTFTEITSFTTLPATPPAAPTNVVATAGNGQATLTFTAPASDGGSPIIFYVATASPGGAYGVTSFPATSIVIPGLDNGTSYTFTVFAYNALDYGDPSSPSNAVTPSTVPGAPANIQATAGNHQVSLTWDTPSANGGSAILNYTVTASPGGLTATTPDASTSLTFPGLTNGTAYTFTVIANNIAGGSLPSTASASTTPVNPAATPPGAPTGITGTTGNGQVTLTFTAPASDGGSPITGYTATASPGGITASSDGATTSITVPGLTNGTAYTFTVVATNSLGSSPPSSPSNSVIPAVPATVPGAPTNLVATAGNAQIFLTWSAPSSDGGSPILNYTITVRQGGRIITTPDAGTSFTVTELTNGIAYQFNVVANNSVGSGAPSPQSALSVIPHLPVPSAPTNVVTTPGNGQVSLSWSAPVSEGGSPITSYTYSYFATTLTGQYLGGVSDLSAGLSTALSVTGLTNGLRYSFTVYAHNAFGQGPPSTPYSIVFPTATTPGAPTGVTGTAGNGQVALTFTAPASDGGSPITGYAATSAPGGAIGVSSGTNPAITVTGLTNGITYTFTVVAFNAQGPGANSAPSAPFTPQAPASLPTVTGISPAGGSIAGGTSVTLTGTNFTGATGVTFGGTAATEVTVLSATSITATTPAHVTGPASVLVTTASGTNSANTLFTYAVVPTLTLDLPSISAPEGSTVGNHGVFTGEPGGTLTVTASTGTVVQNSTGEWTFQSAIILDGYTGDPKLDAAGNLYVNNANGYVTKITPAGVQSNFVLGFQPGGILVDSTAGLLYATALNENGGSDHAGYVYCFQLETGDYLFRFAGPGSGDGQFTAASCLAQDSTGNLYIADSASHRIQVFAPDGTFLSKWGGPGSGDGQFNEPCSMQISGTTLYVTDRGNHRMQKFTTDGIYLGQWGSGGSADGQFNQPVAVNLDPAGNVFVCDLINNRVQKFTPDGVFLDKFGPGSGEGALSFPDGIVFAAGGRDLYITNYLTHNVVKYIAPNSWSWTAPALDGPANTLVTLTATDSALGLSGQVSFPLVVTNVTPTLALSGPATVSRGSSYTLTLGTLADPGADTVSAYTINWGDGVTEPFSDAPGGTRSHTYATTGGKTIRVSLTDEDGTYANVGTLALFVTQPPPVVSSISPASGGVAGGTSVVITGTNFIGVGAVLIGDSAVLGFTVDSATQITATTAPRPLGAAVVDVAVLASAGTGTGAGLFTYVESAYAIWALANGASPSTSADTDADGLSDLQEFAFGTHPAGNASGTGSLRYTGPLTGGGTVAATGQPVIVRETIGNATTYHGLFCRRTDHAASALVYTPQFSADLLTWIDDTTPPTVLADDGTNQIISVPFPTLPGAKRFFRLRLELVR